MTLHVIPERVSLLPVDLARVRPDTGATSASDEADEAVLRHLVPLVRAVG